MKLSYLIEVLIILNMSFSFLFFDIAFCATEDEKPEADIKVGENMFVATNEWQEVKEGQVIPPGLHVRMDLTNGGRWAKLMDDNESNHNALVNVVSKNEDISEQKESTESTSADGSKAASYNFEELKVALKKIKAEKVEAKQEEQETKSKFRSMDEIKEAFEQFNLNQETDVEVMKRLVSVLRNYTASENQKYLALQDLEYYVHQIDNANDLVTIGGFAVVVQVLNGTSLTLKEEAAHVLGSATQSNPKVQIEALRSGVLRTLLLDLASVDHPLPLRKKCMYAISAMIRHFPLAQIYFAKYGGFQIMLHLFQQEDAKSLQLKAIQLVHDLLEERLNAKRDADNPQQKEKLKQYDRINLGKMIKDLGWCRIISSSLQQQEQHHKRESVMRAMKVSFQFCKADFRNRNLIDNIKKLKAEYKKLSDDDIREGDVDSYFSTLFQLSAELVSLCTKSRSRIRDEF